MVQHHLEAVVLDLDGTLLDSERVICDAVSRACARLGREVAVADVAPHLGAPLTELYALYFNGNGPLLSGEPVEATLADDEGYRAFHHAYVSEHDAHEEERPRFLPGVEEALSVLAERGVQMAVATTKPSGRAAEQLRAMGAHRFFGHIQGTDVPMAFKPAPDVVLAACRQLGAAPRACIMVGDTARDVGAGKAAQAATAVVAYSSLAKTRAQTFGADLVLSSLGELLHLPGLQPR